MTVGRLLAQCWAIIAGRIGLLLGLLVTYLVAQFALFLILALILGASMATGLMTDSVAAMTGSMLGVMALFYLLYFLISFAQAASLTAGTSPLQRSSFGEALTAGLRSAPTLLGVGVLFFIGYFVLALGFGLVGAILSVAGKAGLAVLVILAVGVALFLACRLCVLNAVVAVDGVSNPIKAISRSWSLTQGRVMTILGSLLAFGALCIVVVGAAGAPFYFLFNSARAGGAEPGVAVILAMIVLFAFIMALLVIGTSALFSVIHADLLEESGERTIDVFA